MYIQGEKKESYEKLLGCTAETKQIACFGGKAREGHS